MLKKLLADHQLYHSEFQQDYFITVRAGGTEYGQYKQALRELSKRYRGLKELYAEKELLQIDIDELTEVKTRDKFVKRRNEIKRTQKIMAMEDIDSNIKDTEREFERFYQQAVALKEKIGELTPLKRSILDRDMWEFKIKEMASIDFICNGKLSASTVELVMCVPRETRKDLLNQISQRKELIDWYEKREDVKISLPSVDINKLLCNFKRE